MDPSGDPDLPTGADQQDYNNLFGSLDLDELYSEPTGAQSTLPTDPAGTFPNHPNPEIDELSAFPDYLNPEIDNLPTFQDPDVPNLQSTAFLTDDNGLPEQQQQHAGLEVSNSLDVQGQAVPGPWLPGNVQNYTQHQLSGFIIGTAGPALPSLGSMADLPSPLPEAFLQHPQAASSPWTNNTSIAPGNGSLAIGPFPILQQGIVQGPAFSTMTTGNDLAQPADMNSQYANFSYFPYTTANQLVHNHGFQQHDANAWMNSFLNWDTETTSNPEDSTTSAPDQTTQVPLPPSSPIPVQNAPSQVPNQASPANIGVAQGTTQGGVSSGRRRAPSNNPRLPRVRDVMPKSAPHQRVPGNWIASQQATPLGRGRRAGLNQLALFGQDDVPRTIQPLTVERGRSGRASSSQYPSADTVVPARLSLEEICQQYPNHVWGSLLRIFIAENWTAEQIWQALPAAYRHNEASTRPWNYIQAAFGREIDQMTREETGQKRVPAKRKRADGTDGVAQAPPLPQLPPGPTIPLAPSGMTNSAPAPLLSAAIPAQIMDNMTIQELQQHVIQQTERSQRLLRQIEGLRNQSTSENILVQAAIQQYRTRQETWMQAMAAEFGHHAPGENLASLNIVHLLRRVFEFQNPAFSGTETLLTYQARATWSAWRRYLGLVTSWAAEDEQTLSEMMQLAQEIYD